jgi:LDH2 family malate/lactate/ureidoglycolate dehydrogenase
MTMKTTHVAPDKLRTFSAAVLIAHGVPSADATLVADSLVTADLWGHSSHGVLRLPWYVDRIRAGVMDPVTAPEVVVDAGPVAVLDGRDGVGQVLTARAADEALRRADDHGVGAVAIRNSNHFGTAAYFTRMAPPAGAIAILTTNASPAMAPWGGRLPRVGTNPWSIAAPAGRHGIVVMDIANTAVARGKIYLARQNKAAIPPGWALNAAGEPTNDAQEAIDGIILPMAGHKGYAISFMMDVLSGVLTGSAFGSNVGGPYQTERRSGAGHLYLALNVATFMPVEQFDARMEDLIAEVKAVPHAEGFDEIFYPGELEARAEERHLDGLTLPEQTTTDLGKLADETGVALPFS